MEMDIRIKKRLPIRIIWVVLKKVCTFNFEEKDNY